MPELPDILAYLSALERIQILNQPLQKIIIRSPFVLRSYDPPIETIQNQKLLSLHRLGKRIVFQFENDLHLILHLMIAGRLKWKPNSQHKPTGKIDLLTLQFPAGTLLLTEAGTKKRASIHLIQGTANLQPHQPGGLDILTANLATFSAAITAENHTIKRTLTSPKNIDGIGNAYSDEILHAARISPLKWTQKLTDDEIARLHTAARTCLNHWITQLQNDFANRFPDKPKDITAFRKDFAVHGKFEQPCPVCNSPVQRIRYTNNETNYCPTCQTAGKILADRSLSRLLKNDWPRTVEEWEQM